MASIQELREMLRDTVEENKWGMKVMNKDDVLKKRSAVIQAVENLIDIEDKGKVWELIKYILDHARFQTNQDDINNLKAKVLNSRTLTAKMKSKINNGPIKSNYDSEEARIIGNETYDYEDHMS